jgi:hypothetical protein
MGEKLMEYYSFVEKHEGVSGKIELAKRTNLPGTKASTAPDSDERLREFREAAKDITGEVPPGF